MIRSGFLSKEDRGKLIALARDGSAASRVTRRANALVLLDKGWSCQEVADALLLNDDTIRGWHKLFEQRGIEGLTSFDMGGSAGFLTTAQEDALKNFVSTTLPRSTREVGAFIEREFGLVYESRSGLIACCIGWGSNITSRRSLPASSMWRSRRTSSRAPISS
jgi:transposase